jgi:hypothetical protein
MSSAAAIRVMLDKGLALEDALAVVEAFENERDDRSTNARRQARYRERKAAAQSVTNRNESNASVTPDDRNESNALLRKTVTNVTPLARVEDNPSTKKLSGKGRKNIGAKRNATPREFLLECLLPEAADAVLEHRRAMRRPLTGRAAQLLAKGFLATADPNAAADMMIERGWQGFKPEWFGNNERRSNGQPKQGQSRRGAISDVAASVIQRIDEQFAYLDEVRPAHGVAEGGPTVQLLPSQRGKRP